MPLYLDENEPVVVPKPGKQLIFIQGTTPKALKSDGTATSLGAGAVAPWFSNVSQFIQSLQPTLLAATFASECVSLTQEIDSPAAAGTGAATLLTTSPGGIIRCATGATANSSKEVRSKNGVSEPVVHNVRTAKWASATKFKVIANAATFFHRLSCITDEATADTGLVLDQTVSGTNYCLKSGVAAAVDLGVAFDTTAWHTGLVIADATVLKAYIGNPDGTGLVQIGAVGGVAQGTAPNAAGAWNFFPSNLGTAANVESHVDAALVLTERA